jgi:hypothetical protein
MSAAELRRDFEVSDQKPDYGMPIHPVCDLFPLMDASSLAGLAADIGANGLLNAIVLHEGQIVDGRNRLLACREAGQEPRFAQWREVYAGPMSIARWIWSTNAARRNLTVTQMLALEIEVQGWEAREAARQRQAEAGKHGSEGGRGNRKTLATNPSQGFSQPEQVAPPKRAPDVRAKLATATGASQHKVQQALNVQKAAPELLKQVAHGTLTLCEAEKQAKAKRAAPAPAPAPAPSKTTAISTKRQQAIGAASKRRMVEALSQLRGVCRGLSELNASAVRNACTAEEITTWAAIARNAAKELRLFGSKLESTKGENQ